MILNFRLIIYLPTLYVNAGRDGSVFVEGISGTNISPACARIPPDSWGARLIPAIGAGNNLIMLFLAATAPRRLAQVSVLLQNLLHSSCSLPVHACLHSSSLSNPSNLKPAN